MPKTEMLEGRKHLVCQAVLAIGNGVMNGSRGALLYPEAELRKTAALWNGRPVVVYHPKSGAAGTPTVWEKQRIGTVFNARLADGRLVADVWLDEARLGVVDWRIANAVRAGDPLEISTGLYTDNEEAIGTGVDGKRYEGIARNHRPDHLAILPDLKGACSLSDGCGLLPGGVANSTAQEPLLAPAMNFEASERKE